MIFTDTYYFVIHPMSLNQTCISCPKYRKHDNIRKQGPLQAKAHDLSA